MINLTAYKEWKELFNEHISDVWQGEAMPVLKKLSMLLFSIKKEIKKVEDEIDKDVLNVIQLVAEATKKRDTLEQQSIGINNNNKENIQLKQTEISFPNSKNVLDNTTVDSPEIFQSGETHSSRTGDTTGSIIISDDDTISPYTNESPEIKRKKRNVSKKRLKKLGRLKIATSSTVSLLHGLSTHQDSGSESSLSGEQKKQRNVTEKSSMDFLKGLMEHTQVPLDSNNEVCKTNKEHNLVLTPVRSDCDVDLSVVQCTPVQISLPKRKDKTSSYLGKKKFKREANISNSTLTQMFSNHKDKQHEEKSNRFQKNHCTDNDARTNQSSVMGITRMVSYLNTESPSKKEGTLPVKVSQGIITLEPNTQEIADFVEDIRFEDFEDDNNMSLNSAIVVEDDMEEDVSHGINDFLAEAQNVPKHQFEAEPVVRGKARQKLPGWSCKDCEQFYTKQGLKPDEILALNKCSKHRGKYRPRQDTLPGFWDMNMITQETKNTTK